MNSNELNDLKLKLKALDSDRVDIVAQYVDNQIDLLHFSEILDGMVADAIVAGVEGRNAEQRQANLELMFADLRSYINSLKSEERVMKIALDLNDMQLSNLRNMIRLAQIMVTTGGNQ